MRASEIMTSPAVATTPTTPLREAVAVLTEKGFAGLPVVDDEGRVLGTFTEFDALRGIRASGEGITVGELMSVPVEVITPSTEVTEIGRRMLADRLRCLPVVEEGFLVGVVSRRDLLRPLVRPDDAIAAQVHSLMSDYAGHRPKWTVEVDGGCVHVSGEFRDEAERRVLDALARTVPGVVAVVLADRNPAST
ncbi:CBS domain-containing protein [Amycolatopsis alba]|uniref:Signal transduction protein n=1 Tax=Amycolatopsis alba DSM 44262 TaxID=1125972 RepID=A0A229RUR2_AMYAL|nr:CBS domain-containing protein [Amycolatopsis alba]OXM50400.1 signal transduction protein [Amycolatopsis alba DSM 44262]